ncbi:MAG TPA: hypothetical protein VIX12_05915 [Candidatus Binataceae bacterium]
MSRFANALAVFGLAVALAGLSACEPVQNPNGISGGKASSLGTSGNYDSSSMPPPSSAGTVAGGTIDSPQSQALSDYLKHHSLPLVGAQVVTSPSGGKQVILFGFVASDFGKTDAEQKARHYLKDSSMVVDNRIKISPDLAGGHGSSSGLPPSNAIPTDGSDPYAASGSLQDYQNNEPPGAQAYQAQGMQQQYQQYNSAPPSMLTTIIPMLLGGGGMTFGGGSGGFGGGMGGFSSGYAPSYGGYGYPSYPPPMPNSGFSASGVPY